MRVKKEIRSFLGKSTQKLINESMETLKNENTQS